MFSCLSQAMDGAARLESFLRPVGSGSEKNNQVFLPLHKTSIVSKQGRKKITLHNKPTMWGYQLADSSPLNLDCLIYWETSLIVINLDKHQTLLFYAKSLYKVFFCWLSCLWLLEMHANFLDCHNAQKSQWSNDQLYISDLVKCCPILPILSNLFQSCIVLCKYIQSWLILSNLV